MAYPCLKFYNNSHHLKYKFQTPQYGCQPYYDVCLSNSPHLRWLPFSSPKVTVSKCAMLTHSTLLPGVPPSHSAWINVTTSCHVT